MNRAVLPNEIALAKQQIEEEIATDFQQAYIGILKLPLEERFGVFGAYEYHFSLFRKIRKSKPNRILKVRIRIPNYAKAWVAAKAMIRTQLKMM